jgi:hypothetical protein
MAHRQELLVDHAPTLLVLGVPGARQSGSSPLRSRELLRTR